MINPFSLPPKIILSKIPKEDRTFAININQCLFNASSHKRDFDSALSLFNFASSQFMANTNDMAHSHVSKTEALQWKFVAARDATMSVYHFIKIIHSAQSWIKKCKTIEDAIDKHHRNQALARINKHFPTFKEIRNVISHQGDRHHESQFESVRVDAYSENVANSLKGVVSATNPNTIIDFSGNLVDNVLMYSYLGKILQCEISCETSDKLETIKDLYYKSFSNPDFFK